MAWPGSPASGGSHAPRSTAIARRRLPRRPVRPAAVRWGPAPMPSCSSTSAPRSSAHACTARATARSGPGCAMPGSAPRARRVRRLMGQHGLLAPHRVGRPEQRAHDGTITTTVVDAMWGTDMTETVTLREGRARVFVAVDHCSGECVGNHAARSGNRFEALEPVRQGVLRHFGRIEKGAAKGLSLRHDHGSNYMSGDFQDEIAFLGLESSPSFVRQPEGNGVAERFIRTLKENFLWVHTFDTIEELRRGLQDFVAHYNATWLVARHGYRTPNQVRAEQRSLAPCPPANLPLAA